MSKRRLSPARLAERLRRTRLAKGWSQEKAAEDLGVHRVTLARWETRAFPLEGMARRLVELWIESIERELR